MVMKFQTCFLNIAKFQPCFLNIAQMDIFRGYFSLQIMLTSNNNKMEEKNNKMETME